MSASKAQKSALIGMQERLANLEETIELLSAEVKRVKVRIDSLSDESQDAVRKLSFELSSMRGSIAAGERWSKPRPTSIFLTTEELQLARGFGMSEKEYAEQKALSERLGIDLTGKLRKQQQKQPTGGE